MKLIRIITTKVYANAITVVCILVGMKSFPDSEKTIHGAEINDTSYESQADFTFTKGEQKFNYNFKINLTLLCDSGSWASGGPETRSGCRLSNNEIVESTKWTWRRTFTAIAPFFSQKRTKCSPRKNYVIVKKTVFMKFAVQLKVFILILFLKELQVEIENKTFQISRISCNLSFWLFILEDIFHTIRKCKKFLPNP